MMCTDPTLSSGVFMHKILIATLAAGVMAAGVAQSASTTTASFQVTASVAPTCSATASNLNFGTYTPGGGALAINTSVLVKCTSGTTFKVALNSGSTAGGSFAQRLMANGAATLQYNLYLDQKFGTIFGDGSASTQVAPGTGAGVTTANQVQVTVFGSLPDSTTNQAAIPGSYSDTIAVTVSY
jgi:spore coat protein U-like protein